MQTVVTTADGSYGVRGFVTDALPEVYDTFCACGPLPMLRALCRAADKPGFLSLEARMGCGFGACMGCSCKTKYGNKRICRDGPVLENDERHALRPGAGKSHYPRQRHLRLRI